MKRLLRRYRTRLARPHFARGDAARDRGDPAAAVAHYRAGLDHAPWRADLRVQLANALKDMGAPAEAEAAYLQAATDGGPVAAEALFQLGHLYRQTERRDEAVDAWSRALGLGFADNRPLVALAELGRDVEAALVPEPVPQRLEEIQSLDRTLSSLETLRAALDARLRDLLLSNAVPPSAYGRWRPLWTLPAPPAAAEAAKVRITFLTRYDAASLGDLHALIASLQAQDHSNWRLSVWGDDSVEAAVGRLALADDRLCFLGDAEDKLPEGAARAAQNSDPSLLVWLTSGARLDPVAASWLAHKALEEPESDGFVFDADLLPAGPGGTIQPIVRSRPDPLAILERNQLGLSVAVRTSVALARLGVAPLIAPDARLRLIVGLTLADRLSHIPLPLVSFPASADDEAADVHAEVARAMRPRLAAPALSVEDATIAVLIPTRDNLDELQSFVLSLETLADRPDRLRILLIDNSVDAAGGQAVRRFAEAHPRRAHLPLQVPFNWSWLNNRAAEQCDEDILIFANDDMEMLTRGWDGRIREALADPAVGAVGVKLLYPDGSIQHGGIITGWQGSTIHDGLFRPRDDQSLLGRYQTRRTCSAVTGAFLATRRSTFAASGGFDERSLPVAHSDVDYCFRVRKEGHDIVWLHEVEAYHHESKSRGLDHLNPESAARERFERSVMDKRWGIYLARDPWVNPRWLDQGGPLRLLVAGQAS